MIHQLLTQNEGEQDFFVPPVTFKFCLSDLLTQESVPRPSNSKPQCHSPGTEIERLAPGEPCAVVTAPPEHPRAQAGQARPLRGAPTLPSCASADSCPKSLTCRHPERDEACKLETFTRLVRALRVDDEGILALVRMAVPDEDPRS